MKHIEGQVYKIKPEQEQPGLPIEVTLSKLDLLTGVAMLTSVDGSYESSIEILETFYNLKEDFNLLNMPKLTVVAIDEVMSLFDIFAASQNALAGIEVKSKLMSLKSNIQKAADLPKEVSSEVEEEVSPLGKKIA
jgi:hypothetical protein